MATRRNSGSAKAGAIAADALADRAVKPAQAPNKKRKRRKRVREEYVSYLVRLTGWNYHYSFSVSDPKWRWEPGPYSELTTLTISGDLIRPEGCKYKRGTVTFSARAGIEKDDRAGPVEAIGSLTARDDELSAYVFVPRERMAELAAVAQTGRIQIVQFTATKLRYGSALIRNVSMDTRFDEEEW